MDDYQLIMARLRLSYNQKMAEWRDKREMDDWKIAVRQQFLSLLQQEGKMTLLEVGAGTGQDSLFFQNAGLDVICTDLSPAMVEFCRQKGLKAYQMDFLSLTFPPASFDAIYAMYCLLHVPTQTLPTVLQKLRDLLRPGGLFFLCVFGGTEQEGPHEDDQHEPPRFYAHHTDAFMQSVTAPYFECISFLTMPLPGSIWHVQAMTLRRKEGTW
jgi:SAM-dependent methyltransferase